MKLFLLLTALWTLSWGEQGISKVVFDLTSGDPKVFERKVLSGISANKEHFESKLEELEVAVVIHGDAYKFFVQDLKGTKYVHDAYLKQNRELLEKRLTALSKTYHVAFVMCAAGMKANKLVEGKLYPFVTLVANSTIGLIEKQNAGYAYIPIRD